MRYLLEVEHLILDRAEPVSLKFLIHVLIAYTEGYADCFVPVNSKVTSKQFLGFNKTITIPVIRFDYKSTLLSYPLLHDN